MARYAVAGQPFDLDSETFQAENRPNATAISSALVGTMTQDLNAL